MTDRTGNPVPREKRLIEQFLKEPSPKRTTSTTVQYYQKKDGAIFPVRITLSPILLENEFLGVVEVFHDISKEMDIDRAKTEFISLASHQFKTPLTAMCWNTEMLMAVGQGHMPRQVFAYVEKIFSNNLKLVALVETLLNVSRIEMGTFVIVPRPIQLMEIINGILEELSPQIVNKKLRIQTHVQQNLPMINADPQCMRIIIQNLIVNAVKYSFKEGTVSVSSRIHPGGFLLMTVSDQGCGIPKLQQSKIFTKSFRADNAKDMHSDGSGLGLYIAKALVGQSKGRIWFESMENIGSDFHVSLPLS
ncbi:MAG: PAS domain-containing sensor histidine kinase [Candidatus Shapirobacteria bacterium]|jgi:signal transduction histidine kinase